MKLTASKPPTMNVRCSHCLVWIEFPFHTEILDGMIMGSTGYRIDCPGCGRALIMIVGDRPKPKEVEQEMEAGE